MQNLPLGMRTDSVLTTGMILGQQRYAYPSQRLAFFEEVEARLRRLPGVVALAISDSLPPGGPTQAMIYSRLDIAGRPPLSEGTGGMVVWRSVTPEYFSALNIPIRSGHGFQEKDRELSENSVILSASLARRLFPDQDPLLARLRPGGVGPWLTVLGVASDVANAGLTTQNDPEYYVVRKHGIRLDPDAPVPPEGQRSANLILRTSIDPRTTATWVRSEIAAIDPTLPISMESMHQRVNKLMRRPRFNAFLLTSFAGMAFAGRDRALRGDVIPGCPENSGNRRPNGFGRNAP